MNNINDRMEQNKTDNIPFPLIHQDPHLLREKSSLNESTIPFRSPQQKTADLLSFRTYTQKDGKFQLFDAASNSTLKYCSHGNATVAFKSMQVKGIVYMLVFCRLLWEEKVILLTPYLRPLRLHNISLLPHMFSRHGCRCNLIFAWLNVHFQRKTFKKVSMNDKIWKNQLT